MIVKLRKLVALTRRLLWCGLTPGNIRVFCRVRPFLPSEKHARTGPLTAPDVDWVKVPRARKEFEFDKVFQPSSVQGRTSRLIESIVIVHLVYFLIIEDRSSWLVIFACHWADDVFAEIEPIIRSALDGHNVSIFAYGQTGSGKTFTMVSGTSNHLLQYFALVLGFARLCRL